MYWEESVCYPHLRSTYEDKTGAMEEQIEEEPTITSVKSVIFWRVFQMKTVHNSWEEMKNTNYIFYLARDMQL